ncbi:MAG: hypothetical protein M3Z25_10255 [Actinomycetota bacterium]|nr:hypothetical protein [Actinomycetota bacterium]
MSGTRTQRDHAWLIRLAQLFDVTRGERDDAGTHARVEELILGGPRRYTLNELLVQTGMDPELAGRRWRSMGFAEIDGDTALFTDGDRDALRLLEQLRAAGLVPSDIQEAVTRTVGQAMAGLADWQIEMLYQFLDAGSAEVDEGQIIDLGSRVLPLLEKMQTYVWRHLAAAAGRLLTTHPTSAKPARWSSGSPTWSGSPAPPVG